MLTAFIACNAGEIGVFKEDRLFERAHVFVDSNAGEIDVFKDPLFERAHDVFVDSNASSSEIDVFKDPHFERAHVLVLGGMNKTAARKNARHAMRNRDLPDNKILQMNNLSVQSFNNVNLTPHLRPPRLRFLYI
jgi:hypothetical protein